MMIQPFSHKNYIKNFDLCSGEFEPCVICGKGVKNKNAPRLIVGDGNGRFIRPEDVASCDDAGSWPIGPECLRKHRKELEGYVVFIE